MEPPGHAPEKLVNWDVAKGCLSTLASRAPAILKQAVVIGGVACWFYRTLLDRANDPDFKPPQLSPEQESLWLSKDIDFTHFFIQDARDLLNEFLFLDPKGRAHIRIANVPICFAQVGVTFDPEEAWKDAWIATFHDHGVEVECRVLDPITLYREKLALIQKRGAASDRLHCALIAEFLRYETCQQLKRLSVSESLAGTTDAVRFGIAVRDRCREICRDSRVERRLRSVDSASLPPAERKLIADLLA